MAKIKERIPVSGESSSALGSLGDVLKNAGFQASAPEQKPLADEIQKPSEPDLSNLGKVTIRKERKGRAGKTVTIIEGIDSDQDRLKIIAKKMRKSLGCGSHLENGAIVLQGDIVERVRQWLSRFK